MLVAALLLAQSAAPQCAVPDGNLPPSLAGWTRPAEDLAPGGAVVVDTGDTAKLSGVPAGAKAGRGAMIGFRVARAGRYGVALDQAGWIDVVAGTSGGVKIASVAHGHGPACSTVRKIVSFDLAPGVYRLYLTGLATPRAKVMLVPAPDR
ncbi:hypothetical protein [Sphingomonas sp.]|uniref:hypothetical protein n=1 Tax=Sphingomonas sp. TaxID=28214 RepID=UPI001EC2566B|nr:hypothetical protein [Sphingomonas sp.]MBX3594825.1 hypothetical protein [Sphingomonas sp.]